MNRFSTEASSASRLRMLTSTALAASLLCSGSACSETSPPAQQSADESPIETVVISAQKRGVVENAQSVPIALTAVNGVELEDRHVRDLQDLTTAAPNVTLADAGTVPGFANFTIRGLGVNTTIPSMEPAVGVFVDGIYLGMSAGVVMDLFDIRDIQMLRGTPGLHFGRNTTGGAALRNTSTAGAQICGRWRV